MATLLDDRNDVSISVTEPFESLTVAGVHDRYLSCDSSTPNGVTGLHDPEALVWGADLLGLGTALAATLTAPTLIAVADGEPPAAPGAGEPVRFPMPVGTRDAHPIPNPRSTTRILRAAGQDEWSALRVTGERTLAMVDDGRFAAAAILAAAATLPEGPVWNHPETFLNEVRRLGLRFAQAVV